MLSSNASRFAAEYGRGLAAYLTDSNENGLRRAIELGTLAHTLGIAPHEIITIHTRLALTGIGAGSDTELGAAANFLVRACQFTEAPGGSDREQFLRKLAHELRTPLTTLRLSLQIGLGKLEKGEPVTPAALQKALAQVDKLTTTIGEWLRGAGTSAAHPIGQPRP